MDESWQRGRPSQTSKVIIQHQSIRPRLFQLGRSTICLQCPAQPVAVGRISLPRGGRDTKGKLPAQDEGDIMRT